PIHPPHLISRGNPNTGVRGRQKCGQQRLSDPTPRQEDRGGHFRDPIRVALESARFPFNLLRVEARLVPLALVAPILTTPKSCRQGWPAQSNKWRRGRDLPRSGTYPGLSVVARIPSRNGLGFSYWLTHHLPKRLYPLPPCLLKLRQLLQHRAQPVNPGVSIPFAEILRNQSVEIGLNVTHAAFLPKERLKFFPRVALSRAAEDVPEVVQVSRARPFLLLLQQGAQLLGDDLQLAVGGDLERRKLRVRRRYRAFFNAGKNRLVERELHLDVRQRLPARPATLVLHGNLDLKIAGYRP